MSVCLSMCQALSRRYPLNCSIFCNQTCMVVRHHGEKIICCLQGRGHSEGLCNQNVTVSAVFSTNSSFANKLKVMVEHCKPKCPVKIFDCCVVRAESFVTKLCMVIHHHKLGCHAKNVGCYLQSQGHRAHEIKI